ncbi:MAG TPA: hypothetical protein VFH15_14150 [Pyrinomonadaceae bacterium]|nr:hypothetical protein [Pyrinomonadaceae bacterium]
MICIKPTMKETSAGTMREPAKSISFSEYSFLKTITHPDGRVEYRNQLTDPNKGMQRTRQ